jgi:hypothetical protein
MRAAATGDQRTKQLQELHFTLFILRHSESHVAADMAYWCA